MFTFDVKMSISPQANKINYIAYESLRTYSLPLIEAHLNSPLGIKYTSSIIGNAMPLILN